MQRVIATNSVPFAARGVAPPSGSAQYFTSGNPATSVPATVVPDWWLNQLQDELMAPVTAAAIAPDANDWTQLYQSRFLCDALIDASVSANTLTFSPLVLIPPAAIKKGFRFFGQVANTNTSGTVNATISGGTPIPVVDGRGQPPQAGDLRSGRFYLFVHDGAALRVAAGLGPDPVPASGATLWVRTDGNDNNNGSANDAAHAFLTPQAAINYALQRFSLGGKGLTVRLGIAGTYAMPTSIPVGFGTLTILGNTASQDSYILSGTPGSSGLIAANGTNLILSGLNLFNASNTVDWTAAQSGGSLVVQFVTFTCALTNSTASLVHAYPGGSVGLGGAIKINCNFGIGLLAAGGQVSLQSGTAITTVGAPSFTTFAQTIDNGVIAVSSTTITGSGIGQRYSGSLGGLIATSGAGAGFFPGSVAGTPTPGTLSADGSYYN